ncbi:MAG: RHS repeat-associated core domain-containing protein [Deltaproteobacteria bacterium]|nr:RHS repeat-associated core domain-containing protein [Deltaproteobacteria bacterium]
MSYVHSDHLGSTSVATNEGGNVQQASIYSPYGEVLKDLKAGGIQATAHLYTGQELDPESALYNYVARCYDSVLSRFTSIDPVQGNLPYAYANNRPNLFIDPDGKDPGLDLLLLGAESGPPSFENFFLRDHLGNLVSTPMAFSLEEIGNFRPLHAVDAAIVGQKQLIVRNAFSGRDLPSDALISRHLGGLTTGGQDTIGVVMNANGEYVVFQGQHRLVALLRDAYTVYPVEEGFLTLEQQMYLQARRITIQVFKFEFVSEGNAALTAASAHFQQRWGRPFPRMVDAAIHGKVTVGGFKGAATRAAGPISSAFALYFAWKGYQETAEATRGNPSLGLSGGLLGATGIPAFFEAAGADFYQMIGSLCALGGGCNSTERDQQAE